jgi:hypothetical protein
LNSRSLQQKINILAKKREKKLEFSSISVQLGSADVTNTLKKKKTGIKII